MMWRHILPAWTGAGWLKAEEGDEEVSLPIVPEDKHSLICSQLRAEAASTSGRGGGGRGGISHSSSRHARNGRDLVDLYSKSVRVTRHVSRQLLSLMDEVSCHLRFWEVRARGSQGAKLRFMLLERGPIEFVKGVGKVSKHLLVTRGRYSESLTDQATWQIAEREGLLRLLRDRLATAIGDVHKCAAIPLSRLTIPDGGGGGGVGGGGSLGLGVGGGGGGGLHGGTNPRVVICSSLTAIQISLYNLEDSYDLPKESVVSSAAAGGGGEGGGGGGGGWWWRGGVGGGGGGGWWRGGRLFGASEEDKATPRVALSLVEMGLDLHANASWSEWNDEKIERAIDVLYENTRLIATVIGRLVSYYRRPSKLTRRWVRYAGIGLATGTFVGFLIRHSRLAGSDDLERWAEQGGEATRAFWDEHVAQPWMLIKEDLFATFRSRPKGIVDPEEVKLTSESLRRMMIAFVDDVAGRKAPSPDIPTDQELMEMVMKQYEEEVLHPVRNLVGGELMRSLLIQIQRLKLNTETAMLELDQLLRANELNFALMAALPAIILSVFGLEVLRRAIRSARGERGRGRSAVRRRRMLFADVERAVLACHVYLIDLPSGAAQHGMLLYSLEKLYLAVRARAMENREWRRLREDVVLLSNPDIGVEQKLALTASMARTFVSLGALPT
ncbi:hypothetical protein CBR_g51661 [Chara braunii]|uniref:Uncharacterized protein n=1 Tax=Chara braunii TaxID=69332 RepID=A0A388M945_CHABU|nr:hypothetical protein CBR_g51661 [Chara braunii]|eukprot:GBG91003.1 hypothetical protein CBR_g51661 [Chara braunii]